MKETHKAFFAFWNKKNQSTDIFEDEKVPKGKFALICKSEGERNYINEESGIEEKYDKKYTFYPTLLGYNTFKVLFGVTILYKIEIYENYISKILGFTKEAVRHIKINHTPVFDEMIIPPTQFNEYGIETTLEEWEKMSEEEQDEKCTIRAVFLKSEEECLNYDFSLQFCLQFAINIMISKFGKCNIRNFYELESSSLEEFEETDIHDYDDDGGNYNINDWYIDGGGGDEWSDPPDW